MNSDTKSLLYTAAGCTLAVAAGYFLGRRAESAKHWSTEPKICRTILDHVGNTPLVRIQRIAKKMGVNCEVLCKCEFFNVSASLLRCATL